MARTDQTTHVPKGKTAVEGIVTGGAIAIVLVLLNVLTCTSRARVDLTEGRIYSLSDASRALVAGMKEKVNIKAYFGNVVPEYAEKQTYVDMLLSEYADRSNGRIVYEKIDPWNNPALQEELKKDGIDKLRVQSYKDDAYQQVPIYFQVSFSHLDKKEVWTPPQDFTLEGLEYDFTTRIKRLGYGKKKVGITTGFGEPAQARALSAPGTEVAPGARIGLADLYDATPVNWKDNPKSILDVDVLVVNGPTEKVSDAAKYNLDQLIMGGKPVLFLVGGMRWQSGNGQQEVPGFENPDQPYVGMPGDNGLADLLEGYGFKVGQDVILDGRQSAPGVIPPGSRAGWQAFGLFPFAQSSQSGRGGMLEGIDVVALPFASTLKLVGALAKPDAETQVWKLLETSPYSWAKTEVMAITPNLQVKQPDNEHGPYLVAAAVAGKFRSFYADHPVPTGLDLTPAAPAAQGVPGELPPSDGEGDGPMAPAAPAAPAAPGAPAAPAAPTGPIKESASHTRIVVITSPTLVADQTLMSVIYVNGFYAVHNLVDWLAEDTSLIAVRGKKPERPIDRMDPAKRSVIKYANVVGAPLLLVLFGILYWRIRERKRRNIVI